MDIKVQWYLQCIGSVWGVIRERVWGFFHDGSGSGMVDGGGGDGLCMGWNMRVDVCSHIDIWIIFVIFCLAGCFVMGQW